MYKNSICNIVIHLIIHSIHSNDAADVIDLSKSPQTSDADDPEVYKCICINTRTHIPSMILVGLYVQGVLYNNLVVIILLAMQHFLVTYIYIYVCRFRMRKN